MSKDDKDLDFLVKMLKDEMKNDPTDNEAIHSNYDAVMHNLAWAHNPKLVGELDELTNDTEFWYA